MRKLKIQLHKIAALVKDWKRLLFPLLLLLQLILFLLFGHLYCQKQKQAINDGFEKVATKVLLEWLQADSFENTFFATDGRKKSIEEQTEVVYMQEEGEKGPRAYRVTPERSQKNMTKDSRLRLMHSVFLKKHPLVPDSLYERCKGSLKQQGISIPFMVQILTFDESGKIKADPVAGHSLRSGEVVFDHTIGYASEVEVRCLSDIPLMKAMGGWGIAACLFYGVLMLGVDMKVWQFQRRKDEQENEQTYKGEEVRVVQSTRAKIFQLTPDVKFDANLNVLYVGEQKIPMQPATSSLLLYFLEAEGYMLSDEEIKHFYWADKGFQKQRIYTAVNRLRKILQGIPGISINRCNESGYRLCINYEDSNEEKQP